MNQDEMKQAAAQAALDYVLTRIDDDSIIGIGTGSTANFFIDLLAAHKMKFQGAVASSQASADRLAKHRIPVLDLNSVPELRIYVDGADEINPRLEMIKGGGAALTREKIVAAVAREFVCIADHTKRVERLGAFPLPVEVLPMARSYVARQLVKLGGDPVYRQSVVTDNGNVILDMYNFWIDTPRKTEEIINNITGVVCNGIFALRPADVLLLATPRGVETHRAQ